MLCVGLMSEVTSRRPAPPVAYPKDRTRPDLADHAYFYFSHVGRFRRTNHLLLPICCRVSCGQGPWTPGVLGLPPGRLSLAAHALSVRLGSHPLRDEIEAIRHRLPKTENRPSPREALLT